MHTKVSLIVCFYVESCTHNTGDLYLHLAQVSGSSHQVVPVSLMRGRPGTALSRLQISDELMGQVKFER